MALEGCPGLTGKPTELFKGKKAFVWVSARDATRLAGESQVLGGSYRGCFWAILQWFRGCNIYTHRLHSRSFSGLPYRTSRQSPEPSEQGLCKIDVLLSGPEPPIGP